ncbi:13188_t:CDS:2, partial [Ambispora gerdemannii]
DGIGWPSMSGIREFCRSLEAKMNYESKTLGSVHSILRTYGSFHMCSKVYKPPSKTDIHSQYLYVDIYIIALVSKSISYALQDKLEGLLRELSTPVKARLYQKATKAEKRVTFAYQEEIRCWFRFSEKFEQNFKRHYGWINDQQARTCVYDEVAKHLPGFTRESLRKKTAETRNIYMLFGLCRDPTTLEIVRGIGMEKIKRVKTNSADYISKLTNTQIRNIIDTFAN